MQVTNESAPATHLRALKDADLAYNLSHGNVVNTLSHEMKRISGNVQTNELAMFKLYMVQVCSEPAAASGGSCQTVPCSARPSYGRLLGQHAFTFPCDGVSDSLRRCLVRWLPRRRRPLLAFSSLTRCHHVIVSVCAFSNTWGECRSSAREAPLPTSSSAGICVLPRVASTLSACS